MHTPVTYQWYENESKQLQSIAKNSLVEKHFLGDDSKPTLDILLPKSWMEIDLNAFETNINNMQAYLGPRVGVIGVVKADAYGHGIIPIARIYEKNNVDKLAVADIAEAKLLRQAGVKTAIVVLYPPLHWEIDALVKNEIEITICDEDSLDIIAESAAKEGKKAKIHFQVETGMHRYGMPPQMVLSLVKKSSRISSVQVEGISTHFATALTDPDFAKQHQLPVFLDVLKNLASEGITIPTIHIANSPGLMRVPDSWNPQTYASIMPESRICVRPGEIVYGIRRDINYAFETTPVLRSVISHLVDIQAVTKGEAVGYDNGFTAHSDMEIGVIACGWRETSMLFKNTDVLVNDVLSPQIGSIFGNAIAIDNKGRGLKNTRVYLVKQYDNSPEELSVMSIAQRNSMPPTAVISLIGSVLPRVYLH